jgi:hypothetical protein
MSLSLSLSNCLAITNTSINECAVYFLACLLLMLINRISSALFLYCLQHTTRRYFSLQSMIALPQQYLAVRIMCATPRCEAINLGAFSQATGHKRQNARSASISSACQESCMTTCQSDRPGCLRLHADVLHTFSVCITLTCRARHCTSVRPGITLMIEHQLLPAFNSLINT